MSGGGNSRMEAFAELGRHFDHFKASKKKLPRPGTKVPIEFATRNRVGEHPELAQEFTRRILEVDGAWISDDSSLWDFHAEDTNDKYVEKIRQVFGVDVSDITTGNLADIFDRITKSGSPKGLVTNPD